MPSLHLSDLAVSRLNAPGTYYDDATPAFGKEMRGAVGNYEAQLSKLLAA
jgi:hypothetical protein